MAAFARTASSTASSTQVPALAARAARPQPTASRVGTAARRLLSALMRSLANPHM
jgi:hypothetical protein